MTSPLAVIILAAGQGTRMRSALPKVLHRIGGRPLLGHVLATAQALAPETLVVVHGHGADAVRAAFPQPEIRWVLQAEQLGTGHAVAAALPEIGAGIGGDPLCLILYGDVPLLTVETLRRLLVAAGPSGYAILTARLSDPRGYGRILRDNPDRIPAGEIPAGQIPSGEIPAGQPLGIVEEKDASPEQRRIDEVNTGILVVAARHLRALLPEVGNANQAKEYYLTDLVGLARARGIEIATVLAASPEEIAGVNDRAQLAALERAYQRGRAAALMAAGVTLMDPARLDCRGEVVPAPDCVIDVDCVLEGRVVLGAGAHIGPFCHLRDVELGPGVVIASHTVMEGAVAEAGAHIGPYARIRPGTRLAEGARIGNFVEVKQSEIGAGSKVNHLSYIGDTEIGRGVNIGAGTITCNYDGAHKHRTVIGDHVFIGSDTQLVAPVRVGEGATVGAGTTVTKDVPPGALAISRSPQREIAGWRRPTKKKD